MPCADRAAARGAPRPGSAGDERAHRRRPVSAEQRQVADRCLERLVSRIHRAEDDLILQDQIPHDHVVSTSIGAFRPGTPVNTTRRSYHHLHDHERDGRGAGRLVDHIDVPDRSPRAARSRSPARRSSGRRSSRGGRPSDWGPPRASTPRCRSRPRRAPSRRAGRPDRRRGRGPDGTPGVACRASLHTPTEAAAAPGRPG